MYDRISKLGKIGVWECDLLTERLTWTPAVYEMFDLPVGSVIDRAATLACYEPNSRREMERRRAQAIATCSSFNVDVAIRTQCKNLRWIRITGDVQQESSRATKIFGTKQDITREKEAQLQLQALQSQHIHLSRVSAIEATGSTLAHELNQPLAAIALYVAALRNLSGAKGSEREQIASEQEEILDGIERCTLKSGNIIRAIRRLTAKSNITAFHFALNDQIVEACRIALAGSPEGIRVRYVLQEGLQGFGDPVQIQQVVINLISNACIATAGMEFREITVTSAEVDGQAEVAVCDTGSGISAEVMASLFEPFVSSRPDGTGIGLSICRTIVEAHSGKLVAENNRNRGATFRFRIPTGVPCAGELVNEAVNR
ncbi:ATP-binding protein [Altererythrobacter sp. KTW20L]|uniref:sensor histidine kinase n=1 Tax=Altererythrobacter sp. KTW20L TaxID=2942210 RepID=UPI0020BE2FF9|nr:HAMP domain-containing sensor histidine kinase [Altererythrobacter sp. KTW20L]MCL6252256.1 ATP-binding protein [Altererythrobacter sp. KTW20L]